MSPRQAADLLRQIDRVSPALARLIARELGRIDSRLTLDVLEDALKSGDAEALIKAANLDAFRAAVEAGLVRIGARLLEVVGAWAMGEAAIVAGKAVAWDAVKGRVLAAARRSAASQVVAITDAARDHLRSLVTGAIDDEIIRRRLAGQIKKVVTLDPQQAKSLAKFRADVNALVESGQLTRRQAGQKVGQYVRALKNDRAWRITRTELRQTLEEGRLNAWQAAQADGLLPASVRKRWIARIRADNVCKICYGLHGQTVKLGETFVTIKGVLLDHPTAHPKCQCTEQLVDAKDTQPAKPIFIPPARGPGLRPKLPKLIPREARKAA